MSHLRRSQAGFTLIEVLVAMSLMTLVLGIASQAFIAMWDENKTTTGHNESSDFARMAMDRLARDLRNLASPVSLTSDAANRPRAVERADPFDLVFRTVDEKPLPAGSANSANVMRVRFCLDSSKRDNNRLIRQTQRWTTATAPSIPPPDNCPSPGWNNTRVLAQRISNWNRNEIPRPVFGYNATSLEMITRVRTQLFVDTTPGRRPLETQLVSGVTLRNQNQYPVADFTITQIGISGSNRVLRFDGSASRDPEAQALRFCWYVDAPSPAPDCTATPKPATYVGEGIVFTYTMPAGSHTVTLRVEDPAGLRDDEVKPG